MSAPALPGLARVSRRRVSALSCRVAFISIFNDVLGPVMRGPSSSHTAGAYHIARLARDLAGELPRTIRCAFDPDGSYAPTYGPLGVDLALPPAFFVGR